MIRSNRFKKQGRQRADNSVYKIERSARDRADDQARRIPWKLLLETRQQFVKMQELYFWARSVIETENDTPGWLRKILDRQFPGFLEDQKRRERDRPNTNSPPSVRLLFWIQENMFSRAKDEGWFDAVQFYAIRDRRTKQAKRLAASKIESKALTSTQRTNRPAYANSGTTDRDRASWVPKPHHSNPSIPWCVWRADDSSQTTRSRPSNLPFWRPERSGP